MYALDFGPLYEGLVGTDDQEVSEILESLAVLLGCNFWPGVCGMCLSCLNDNVGRFTNFQCFWKIYIIKRDSALFGDKDNAFDV